VITDAAKQQTAIQTYYTALAQLTPLAGEVTTMIQALKVK
jgi:hypothetical protein